MTARYRVLLEARRELVESADHYEREKPGLGGEFVLEYESVVEHMRKHPEAGSPMTVRRPQPQVRKFHFTRFKHTLFAVVLPDELVVIALAHQHRKPRYWRKRLAKVQP